MGGAPQLVPSLALALALVLVLVLSLATAALHPDCFETTQQRLQNNATEECRVVDYTEKLNRWKRPLPVRWDMLDPDNGLLRIMFPLLYGARGNTSYTVTLLVNETVTPEECKLPGIFDMMREKEVHTKITFDPKRCHETRPDDGLPKGMEVEFKYIFSGCYRLKVAPKGNPNNFSANLFLRTNYVKQILEPPNITRNFYQNKNVAFISFKYSWGSNLPLVVSMRHGIKPEMGSQACQTSGTIYSCCALNLPEVGSEICESNSNEVKSPNCKFEGDGLTCEFFNLVPGNYCFAAEVLHDVRCRTHGNVWKNRCLWNSPIEITAPEDPPAKMIDDHVIRLTSWTDSMWYFLGPILAISFVLALVLYGFRLHKKATHISRGETDTCTLTKTTNSHHSTVSWSTDHSDSTTSFKIQARNKVLLLYPQDCQPFMDMMAAFRSVLARVARCEVYDVFDVSLLNEIAPGPMDWLRRLILQQDTMVVVVETRCAALHQRALDSRCSLQYAQPLPNSRLFTYGLQTVAHSLQGDAYSRFFVVRFKGFSDDDEGLSHLTPYRRFTIPTHLDNLVDGLKDSYTINPEDYDLRDLKEFYSSLENAVIYKETFPNYLGNLFARSSESV